MWRRKSLRIRRKSLWVNGPLAAAVVAVAVFSYATVGSSGASAAPQTSPVAGGTVLATVSASGTLQAPRNLGLNFYTGGRVTAIYVRVGQRVRAGQVLARVDATSSRQSLSTARASLAAAEAALAAADQGETAAQRSAANAQAASADAQVRAAESALAQERKVVAANAASYEQQVDAAQSTLSFDQAQLNRDEAKLAQAEQQEQQDCSKDPTGSACQQDKSTVSSDQSTVDQDKSTVLQAQNNLSTAKEDRATGLARDRQSIAQDQSSVNTAKKSYQSTVASNTSNATPSQSQIAQDESTVTSDRVQVEQAQEALRGTTLTAPAGGTIASISNNIGDYVSGTSSSGGSGGSSSTGSGSGSSSTGSSGSSGSGGGGSSSSGSSSGSGAVTTNPSGPGTGSGGAAATTSATGFMVLTGLSGLEVYANFAETDAAKVRIGAGASVTVNALPSQQLSGTVVQIDPTSTTNNSVVDYGVTLTLGKQVSALRPGQTVSVSVITAEASNALYVPSSAVSTAGGQSTVKVSGANGQQRTVPVTIGVQGDSTTQILSGLHAGERVVTSASSSGFPAGGFPNLGGGLGGRG